MAIKVKRIGKWKIGDIVFKDDPRYEYVSHPTPAGWEIIRFSDDKTKATVRCLILDRDIVTCPIKQLQEFGSSPHPWSAWEAGEPKE